MMPRRRMPSTIVSTPSSTPTACASFGVLQAEVVVDQRAGVGQEGLGRPRVELELHELLVVLQLVPGPFQLGRAPPPGVRAPGGVVPEETLERGVHQGALDGVRGRRLGQALDLREAEGQRAVGEGGDLRRRQGAREIERHARQDTAGHVTCDGTCLRAGRNG